MALRDTILERAPVLGRHLRYAIIFKLDMTHPLQCNGDGVPSVQQEARHWPGFRLDGITATIQAGGNTPRTADPAAGDVLSANAEKNGQISRELRGCNRHESVFAARRQSACARPNAPQLADILPTTFV